MELTTNKLIEHFKLKIKTTIPKKKLWIYNELLREDDFIDADELYFRLYKKRRQVSLSTIYGALKTLEGLGLIKKKNSDDKISVFKMNIEKLYSN